MVVFLATCCGRFDYDIDTPAHNFDAFALAVTGRRLGAPRGAAANPHGTAYFNLGANRGRPTPVLLLVHSWTLPTPDNFPSR